ncbi:hypothetical protein JTB14_025376 [Gonioctena quinquepunctata]|nr:hypothetical protein JTB14_025376 [Gonioctena quinquepunctata]
MSLRPSQQTDAAKVVPDETLSTSKSAQAGFQTLQRVQRSSNITKCCAFYDRRSQITVQCCPKSGKEVSMLLLSFVMCYLEAISVTETAAPNKLQALLDHTTSRIIKCQEVFSFFELNANSSFISKWGVYGTNTSQYHQKHRTEGGSDSCVFITSLVPHFQV